MKGDSGDSLSGRFTRNSRALVISKALYSMALAAWLILGMLLFLGPFIGQRDIMALLLSGH